MGWFGASIKRKEDPDLLAARATSEATAPGSTVAAAIRSFSARDHRRRRCTDVITSTCVLVIGLSLGLVL
jgi:hypothetical protein